MHIFDEVKTAQKEAQKRREDYKRAWARATRSTLPLTFDKIQSTPDPFDFSEFIDAREAMEESVQRLVTVKLELLRLLAHVKKEKERRAVIEYLFYSSSWEQIGKKLEVMPLHARGLYRNARKLVEEIEENEATRMAKRRR